MTLTPWLNEKIKNANIQQGAIYSERTKICNRKVEFRDTDKTCVYVAFVRFVINLTLGSFSVPVSKLV